ncbi:hypothetical protein CHLNCDRAFT_136338 [Chlorella variabilis]|uniref:ER membrane protein complex subunit 2 n=1 Tax=Chlorella variabilis TaxID=554065 RepID=E1ZK57_CHLVA|nr:hypothetical protein CHLNCDRAFT_136338 [Chlorella variabilis]EFN53747.1 hypothetical protein CHLNCDRAFT_136338 [Chlorella variabilis]|eukprot:XP_005845849.1 hypothetical protein CHLNCDRAFT_136338 [Chlorella variabilis]
MEKGLDGSPLSLLLPRPLLVACPSRCVKVRALRVRETEGVVRYGAELLSRHARKVDADEMWEVHEQVAVAAMEAGCKQLALRLVQNVHKRFPEGARASRLTGMYFEMMGTPGEAEELYKKELEKDPANAIILKRMVGLRRGQGDLAGAAELLKQYLAVHTTDWVAWEEAADLYLHLQMYQQAAFCLEELLLHQPTDVGRHLLLADALYTMGGAHNWRAARTQYSGVIEMTKGQNLRALYGVCACAAQLSGVRRSERGGGADVEELPRLAAAALQQQYAVHCPDKLPLVRSMLKAQGLL